MPMKGLDIKNTTGFIQYADAYKKIPFYENVSDLTSFSQDLELFSCFFPRIYFLQYFNSCDHIS